MSYIPSLLMAAMASVAVSSTSLEASADVRSTSLGKETLIVYLSRTGNTEAVAEMIQELAGGHRVPLELETPYPEDYETIVAQVDRENDTGYLPPLATTFPDIQAYDTVFLGFPTWDMQLPPPMKSFLSQYDMTGKTVIPFNTNGGYGVGSSFQDVSDLATGARIREGFSVRGGLERDGIYLAIEGDRREEVRSQVRDWLNRIGLL